MRKNISLNLIELFFIIVFIIISVVLIVKIPDIISTINTSNKDLKSSYLAVIGNISGGIIGGIVAYFVAAYQVSKTKEQDFQNSLKESYASMYLLLDELEYNYTVLEKTLLSQEDIQAKGQHLKKQLFTNQWSNINPAFAQHIESSGFKNICKLYRKIQFIILNSKTIDEKFIASVKGLTETVIRELRIEVKNIYNRID